MVTEPPEGCQDTDQVDPSASSLDTSTGGTPDTTAVAAPEGRRTADIEQFFQSLQDSRHEPFGCTFADMALISERRHWLRSSFTFKCRMCSQVDVIESEPRPEKDYGRQQRCFF